MEHETTKNLTARIWENRTRFLVRYFFDDSASSCQIGPFYRRSMAERAAIRLAGRHDVRNIKILIRDANEEDD